MFVTKRGQEVLLKKTVSLAGHAPIRETIHLVNLFAEILPVGGGLPSGLSSQVIRDRPHLGEFFRDWQQLIECFLRTFQFSNMRSLSRIHAVERRF